MQEQISNARDVRELFPTLPLSEHTSQHIRNQSHSCSTQIKLTLWHCFGQAVCNVVLGVNPCRLDLLLFHHVPNEVIPHRDMLCARVEHWIHSQLHRTLIVNEESSWTVWRLQQIV